MAQNNIRLASNSKVKKRSTSVNMAEMFELNYGGKGVNGWKSKQQKFVEKDNGKSKIRTQSREQLH